MIIKDKSFERDIRTGVVGAQHIINYLLRNYNIMELAEALSQYIMEEATAPAKITITEEEFAAHFKIRGLREDGTPETRGKKSYAYSSALQALKDPNASEEDKQKAVHIHNKRYKDNLTVEQAEELFK